MSELVDRTIVALRTEHDTVVTLLPNLTDDLLSGPSGAADWSIAQVLSHLGSSAELGVVPLLAALEGGPAPEVDNRAVWARWDAAAPVDQAAGYVEHVTRYVEVVEGLTAAQRSELQVQLSFMPQPLPVSTVLGMRLNESAMHGWDVRVGLDPAAGLMAESAELLATHFAGDLGFLLGFVAKPDQLTEPARVAAGEVGLVVDDQARVTGAVADPTATFEGPLEALVRLLAGRLTPEHTPEGVAVTGNVGLDDLRRVFPGY